MICVITEESRELKIKALTELVGRLQQILPQNPESLNSFRQFLSQKHILPGSATKVPPKVNFMNKSEIIVLQYLISVVHILSRLQLCPPGKVLFCLISFHTVR